MKDNLIYQNLIKYGLYAGAILASYFIILYLLDLNFIQFTIITFLVESVVLFIFAFVSISETRKELPDNRIKFLPAWLLAGAVFFIGLGVFGITKMLIFFVIDPDYLNRTIDEIILKIMDVKDRVPNVEESIEGMDKLKDPMTWIQQILVIYTIKSAALGAFIAGVAKKKNRLEETL